MSPLVLRTAPIISSLVQCISWRKNGEAGAQDVPGRTFQYSIMLRILEDQLVLTLPSIYCESG